MRLLKRRSLLAGSGVYALATFTGAEAFAADRRTPPYNDSRYRRILDVAKLQYPNSGTRIEEGDFQGESVTNRFYLRGSVMTFSSVGSGRRCELRLEYEFRPNSGTNRIYGRVRPRKPETSSMDQFTFMQLHEYRGDGPVCRMAWRRSRSGIKDHVWAAVRTRPGRDPEHFDFGPRSSSFQNFEMRTSGGKLRVRYGSRTRTFDISDYNSRDLYWKLGAYNQDSGTSVAEFSSARHSR